jgi:predicted ribosomally synthesized peptide with nif11-like leader
MSQEAVRSFLKHLDQNESLEKKLQSESAAAKDPVACVVAFGGRCGFQFTAEEFVQSQAQSKKLSDEELGGVGGGSADISYRLRIP